MVRRPLCRAAPMRDVGLGDGREKLVGEISISSSGKFNGRSNQ